MYHEIEYQELSADWRHRDSLTWQVPAVIVAVAGFLVSKGFDLIGGVAPGILRTIFIFATGFAVAQPSPCGETWLYRGKTHAR